MSIDKNLLEEAVRTAPLALVSLNDKSSVDFINSLLPYSTGFEIECEKGPNYNEDEFKAIPDIVHVQVDSWEQRYRIPNGLRGLVCLYNISTKLKEQSLLNPMSGIHYHVDCTSCYDIIRTKDNIDKNRDWTLNELDKWKSKYDYGPRDVGNGSFPWVRLQPGYKTFEFRIGEMTFDYELLVERIIDVNRIMKRWKDNCDVVETIKYEPIDRMKIMSWIVADENVENRKEILSIDKRLAELYPKSEFTSQEEMRNILKNRVVKIKI